MTVKLELLGKYMYQHIYLQTLYLHFHIYTINIL